MTGTTLATNIHRRFITGLFCTALTIFSASSPAVVINSGGIYTLQADNLDGSDFFGHALAVSGNGLFLAVGAPYEDSSYTGIRPTVGATDNLNPNSGAVYLYARKSLAEVWTLQAFIKSSASRAATTGGLFGSAVSISADGALLAVGAPGENNGSGTVHMYRRNNTSWSEYYSAATSCWDWAVSCGASVALSGNGRVLLIGAPDTGGQSGAAYMYVADGECLICGSKFSYFPQSILPSNVDYGYARFGTSVALNYDGSAIAIGAPGAGYWIDHDIGPPDIYDDVGLVYVVNGPTSVTPRKQTIVSPSLTTGGLFGFSVALPKGSNRLAVGAPGEDNSRGAVYAYNGTSGTTCTLSGSSCRKKIAAANGEAGDGFGYSVSFTADGYALIIGAPFEDSLATGANGDQFNNLSPDAGAAYIFRYSDLSRAWGAQDYLKAPDTFHDDHYGGVVAVAGDGLTIAVGAPIKGGNVGQLAAGAAYVY